MVLVSLKVDVDLLTSRPWRIVSFSEETSLREIADNIIKNESELVLGAKLSEIIGMFGRMLGLWIRNSRARDRQ